MERGSGAKALLQSGRIAGIEPESALFAVEAGGLVAAVSRVSAEAFQEEGLNALLQDLPRVSPVALRHHQAIQALQEAAEALIPLSLGAVYRSPRRIANLLERDRAHFRLLLARVRSKREMGLAVTQEAGSLLAAAKARSERLRLSDDQEKQSGPGRAFLARKRRERAAAEETDRLTAQWLAAMLARVSKAGGEFLQEELPAAAAGEKSLILKGAFLVASEKVEAFRSLAAALGREYGPLGLHLEVNGPWPPYSFVGSERRDKEIKNHGRQTGRARRRGGPSSQPGRGRAR
jgi:hypothetical protein